MVGVVQSWLIVLRSLAGLEGNGAGSSKAEQETQGAVAEAQRGKSKQQQAAITNNSTRQQHCRPGSDLKGFPLPLLLFVSHGVVPGKAQRGRRGSA